MQCIAVYDAENINNNFDGILGLAYLPNGPPFILDTLVKEEIISKRAFSFLYRD